MQVLFATIVTFQNRKNRYFCITLLRVHQKRKSGKVLFMPGHSHASLAGCTQPFSSPTFVSYTLSIMYLIVFKFMLYVDEIPLDLRSYFRAIRLWLEFTKSQSFAYFLHKCWRFIARQASISYCFRMNHFSNCNNIYQPGRYVFAHLLNRSVELIYLSLVFHQLKATNRRV